MSLKPRPCTQDELTSPESRAAAAILGESFSLSRKLWEWIVIYEAFRELRLFRPHCLGFGVGKEPLPVAFARLGGLVTATDQAPEKAQSWIESDQYGGAERYGGWNLAFRHVDMNAIPTDLHGRFDVIWSACALEHLGGLGAGEDFVVEAMKCLKPGGFALHTTELNVTSDVRTVDAEDLCFYRRSDVERLFSRLRLEGHEVAEPDWRLLERVGPPGPQDRPHLALTFQDFVATSFFFAVKKCLS